MDLYRGHGGWGRACLRPVRHRSIQQYPVLALGTNLVDSIVRGRQCSFGKYEPTKENQLRFLLDHGVALVCP